LSVERVNINPSRIVLKDASGNEKFNTDNFYLKTDPNGTLKAGGYLKTPMVYGGKNPAGSIRNHDNGWFTGSIVDWQVTLPNGYEADLDIYVPRYDSVKIESTPYAYVHSVYPSVSQPFYFNGNYCGQFRYEGVAGNINGVTDGDGNYALDLFINIVLESFSSTYSTSATGGYFRFPKATVKMLNWSRPMPDGYGGTYYEYFVGWYRTNTKAGVVYTKPVRFRPFAIMTVANPVNLSIAVTP